MRAFNDSLKNNFFNQLEKKAVEKKLLNNSFLFTPAKCYTLLKKEVKHMMNMGPIFAEMQRLQRELKNMTIEVSEGEGAFRVLMNGYQEVQSVAFDPAALSPGNAEALQVMVAGAFNRAIVQSKEMIKNEIAKITGGLNLPNIPGLF